METSPSIPGIDSEASASRTRRRLIAYVLLGSVLLVAFMLLSPSTWVGNKTLHTLMETIATLLAFMVGILGLVRYHTRPNNAILFVGVGFLGAGLLDGYHTVVTSEWFDQLWPSPPPSLAPWSWNASRTFLAILMFLSWVAWRHERRLGSHGAISARSVYLIVVFLTFGTFVFFAFTPLPRAYYPEYVFGRPEEFLSAFFFLLALIGYLHKGAWKTEAFEHWLVLSLIVAVVCQGAFMPRSFQLYDGMFDLAHLLKKMSYVLVLTGLLISLVHVLWRAERDKAALAEQKQALEEANTTLAIRNAELDEFTHVASHDLQEPLRKLTSFCDLLELDIGENLSPQARQDMDFISEAARRMQRLISDLLALSRAGRAAMRIESVDLDRCADIALEALSERIAATGAIVTRDSLPVLDADSTVITQLYQNLIANALKFMPPNTNPRIHLSAETLDGHVVLGVRDNGIGIKEEYLARIFEPFKRLHGRSEFDGSGIGLSICRKAVERHGGQLWVESVPGSGSHFRFYIR